MKDKLQELIKELDARKLKAEEVKRDFWGRGDYDRIVSQGEIWAFNFCIQQLRQILNEATV